MAGRWRTTTSPRSLCRYGHRTASAHHAGARCLVASIATGPARRSREMYQRRRAVATRSWWNIRAERDVDEVGGDHCAQRSNHREAPVGMPVEAGNGEMRRSTAGAGVGEVVVDDVVARCVDRSSGSIAQSSG